MGTKDTVDEILSKVILIGGSCSQENSHAVVIHLNRLAKALVEIFGQPTLVEAIDNAPKARQQAIKEMKAGISEMDKYLKENERLAKEKELIEKNHEALRSKMAELEEVKRKRQVLSAPENDLSRIGEDIAKFNGDNNGLIAGHMATLEKLTGLLADANNDVEKQFFAKAAEAERSLSAIRTGQLSVLHKLDTEAVRTVFTDFATKENNLVMEYNSYADKINSIRINLEDISAKHEEVISTFKAYHLDDKLIYGELEDREGVKTHVTLLSREIEDRLLKFDTEIKNIIQRRSELPVYKLEEMKKYKI